MPQFDPSVWSPQIVWLAISFVVLYLLMTRVVLPRLSDVLEEREHKINENLRRAEVLREDSEVAVAEYERTMSEARSQAQESLRAVREQITKEAADRHAELGRRLHADVTAAEARIADARDKAAEGIRDMAIDVAAAAAERLLGARITKKSVATAVDAVMEKSS
jgi:F-type H+-transporting ATPase subunit b